MEKLLDELIELLSKNKDGLSIQVISSLLNQQCSTIKNLIWKVNDLSEKEIFKEIKLRGFQNFSLVSLDLDVIKEKFKKFERCMDSYEFLILKCLRVFDEDGAPLWQLEKELHQEGLSAVCIQMFLKKIKESAAGIFIEYSQTKWKILDDTTSIAEIIALYGAPTKPALMEPEHKIDDIANHVFVTTCRELAATVDTYYKNNDVQVFESKDYFVSISKKGKNPFDEKTTQGILVFARDIARALEDIRWNGGGWKQLENLSTTIQKED